MKLITPEHGECLIDLAKRCDALYVCPKHGSRRLGPLVPYAGKDSKGNNLVGDIYFNFRKIEPHLKAVEAFAEGARLKLIEQDFYFDFDTIIGIPNGGRTFGQELARLSCKRFVYPDKMPKPKEDGKKQEYTWDLSQFEFEPGERVAVAEDVFNNFNNTDNTLAQVEATGAKVVLLVGALNRSPIYDISYKGLPVIASIREAYPEYEQDDPVVLEDIKKGNLELNVKANWPRLTALMNQ